METYPYDESWLESVDKSGEDYRAYCEAKAQVKRFLKNSAEYGREVAKAEWNSFCEILESTSQGVLRLERLKRDFCIIGRHEAEVMKKQALKQSPEQLISSL